ncbi:MAG: hypothetical protein FWC70_02240, partial [Defluviitaleaceae bacterium]|nr:hypothetical protein [Defluviitaleaceae bacterium]
IDKSILPAITESEKTGNITHSDAFELIRLLSRLYDYLYDGIEEFKLEEVKSMLADTLVLEYDVELAEVEARHEERLMAEKKATARKMKKYGDSVEKISDITGLSIIEIDKI